MGYDESREGYERAHAEHRVAHGPGGERGRYAPLLPKELGEPQGSGIGERPGLCERCSKNLARERVNGLANWCDACLQARTAEDGRRYTVGLDVGSISAVVHALEVRWVASIGHARVCVDAQAFTFTLCDSAGEALVDVTVFAESHEAALNALTTMADAAHALKADYLRDMEVSKRNAERKQKEAGDEPLP